MTPAALALALDEALLRAPVALVDGFDHDEAETEAFKRGLRVRRASPGVYDRQALANDVVTGRQTRTTAERRAAIARFARCAACTHGREVSARRSAPRAEAAE